MEKTLFRKKNLETAGDPEQLDTYLKVTSFGAWFVVAAAFLVILAIVIWASAGKIQTVITGAGYCTDGRLVCYFSADDIQNLSIGDQIKVESKLCRVTDVDAPLYLEHDIPYEVLYLLPEERWYRTATLEAELKDGLYKVQFVIEEKPVSFLSERE